MRNCSLSTQTKKIKAVIDYPFNASLSSVEDDLRKDGYLYAMIIHDKDVKDDGELKVKHIHLVLRSQSRHQVAYFLRYISDVFDCRNKNGEPTTDNIFVMLSESFEWDLQYLIHKNDKTKYQYDKSLIMHNLNNVQFEEMLNLECFNIVKVEDVIRIITHSKNEIDIVCKLGIGNYNLYGKLIQRCLSYGYLGKDLKDEAN